MQSSSKEFHFRQESERLVANWDVDVRALATVMGQEFLMSASVVLDA